MSKLFRKTIVYPLVAVLLLIFLHYTNLLLPVENVIVKWMNPVTSTFYSWGGDIRGFFRSSGEKEDLRRKVEELEKEVNRLMAEKHELQAVKEENEKLRQYLDFSKDKDFFSVFAEVVSTTLDLGSGESKRSILINRGSSDGVEEEAIVVNNEGVVVGKIKEVKNNVSRVELLTSEECKLAATVANENRVMGISRGEMGLTVVMEFIPQTEDIRTGDVVVTSGLERNIPPGLVIGKVTEVNNKSNEVWQSVNIEPLVDLDELTIVAVVIDEEGGSDD